MSDRLALVAGLRERIAATLGPKVAGAAPYALLDFPNQPNVGDSAIWLGEVLALRELTGAAPGYTCDLDTFDPRLLRRRIGRGTVFLHGGGNLGDLWASHQRFREQVIRALPDQPIVQLPQSMHFDDPAASARAAAVFDGHQDLTLFVRDRRSLELAHSAFRAPAILCPDLAFWLGPLPRNPPPSRPLLWLARTDHEAARASGGDRPGRADWLGEPRSILRGVSGRLTSLIARHPRLGPSLRAPLSATYGPLARQRVERGCRMLSSARTVVTDRLHGHILCLLLGIPHVLTDTRHGKLRAFHETWTAGCDLARWAPTADAALALAGAAD